MSDSQSFIQLSLDFVSHWHQYSSLINALSSTPIVQLIQMPSLDSNPLCILRASDPTSVIGLPLSVCPVYYAYIPISGSFDSLSYAIASRKAPPRGRLSEWWFAWSTFAVSSQLRTQYLTTNFARQKTYTRSILKKDPPFQSSNADTNQQYAWTQSMIKGLYSMTGTSHSLSNIVESKVNSTLSSVSKKFTSASNLVRSMIRKDKSTSNISALSSSSSSTNHSGQNDSQSFPHNNRNSVDDDHPLSSRNAVLSPPIPISALDNPRSVLTPSPSLVAKNSTVRQLSNTRKTTPPGSQPLTDPYHTNSQDHLLQSNSSSDSLGDLIDLTTPRKSPSVRSVSMNVSNSKSPSRDLDILLSFDSNDSIK